VDFYFKTLVKLRKKLIDFVIKYPADLISEKKLVKMYIDMYNWKVDQFYQQNPEIQRCYPHD
jgi:hypothetical protein